MSAAIHDVFFQTVKFIDGTSQQLFSLRNFEVVDKQVQSMKF